MHWYKRDPDAALAGMAELSLEECGAYNRILDLLYSRDGDVPDNDESVAKMISCHWRSWRSLKKRLIEKGKIWVEGGKITARRVQETLKEASELSQKQRTKAARRWQKSEKINENNEPVMPPGNASTSTSTSTTTATEERKRTRAVARWTVDEGQFLEFWAKYPHKTKKPLARIALAKALKKATFAEIMAGVDRYIVEKPEYADWAMPTSWLNGERWTDQPKNGVVNGQRGPRTLQDDSLSVSKAADRLIERVRDGTVQFAPRPRLVAPDGESNIRLLPPGRGT